MLLVVLEAPAGGLAVGDHEEVEEDEECTELIESSSLTLGNVVLWIVCSLDSSNFFNLIIECDS